MCALKDAAGGSSASLKTSIHRGRTSIHVLTKGTCKSTKIQAENNSRPKETSISTAPNASTFLTISPIAEGILVARATAADTPCSGAGGGRRVGGLDQVGMLDEVDAGRWGGGAATEEEELDSRRQQWIHKRGGVRGVPLRRWRRIHDDSNGS